MKKVIICQELRLASQRLPRKILEEIGGRPLISIGLEKLQQIALTTQIPVCVAACPADDVIFHWADAYRLSTIERSERSVNGETWDDIYDGWQTAFSGFDAVLFINAVCHPFLSAETITHLCRYSTPDFPWVPVKMERGQVWGRNCSPLLPSDNLINSKTGPAYLRPTHLGLSCPTTALVAANGEAPMPVPLAFAVPPNELIDIDTQEDLDLARIVHAGLVSIGKARRDPRS